MIGSIRGEVTEGIYRNSVDLASMALVKRNLGSVPWVNALLI